MLTSGFWVLLPIPTCCVGNPILFLWVFLFVLEPANTEAIFKYLCGCYSSCGFVWQRRRLLDQMIGLLFFLFSRLLQSFNSLVHFLVHMDCVQVVGL